MLRRLLFLVLALLAPIALALGSQMLVATDAPPRLPRGAVTVEVRPTSGTPSPGEPVGMTIDSDLSPTADPTQTPSLSAAPHVSEVPPAPRPVNPSDPDDDETEEES